MKNVYNELIAALKKTGLSDKFSCALAEHLIGDIYDYPVKGTYNDDVSKERLIMIKKAIQATLIKTA